MAHLQDRQTLLTLITATTVFCMNYLDFLGRRGVSEYGQYQTKGEGT